MTIYEVTGNMRNLSSGTRGELEKERPSSGEKVQEQRLGRDVIVHHSQATREEKAVWEVLATLSEVRKEKVALMKEKIASGAYQINYEALAERLVNALLEDEDWKEL